ncbi:MAG: BolA family transcriptional regulator [PS1 clade bacterium]|nr:BolA family transcriptional regulator [PS1 clade bacterium]MBL6783992.1 BolA family transcriptional regulator [PS1 clade bacterium]
MTQVYTIIEQKLSETYKPQHLQVIDESHLHEGHAGAQPGGETHFRVHMVANMFDGMSRIDRQRHVLACLADELKGPVHALALKLKSPQEAAKD